MKANPTRIAQLAIIETKRDSIVFWLNSRLHGRWRSRLLSVSESKSDKLLGNRDVTHEVDERKGLFQTQTTSEMRRLALIS
jgi:hypothetical protein